MKKLRISALALILANLPLMNANASNVSSQVEIVEAKASNLLSDTMITAKVKELFLEDPTLDALQIHVKTQNQIVTLTGKVDSKAERNLAVDLAKNVKDVKSVSNQLKIMST